MLFFLIFLEALQLQHVKDPGLVMSLYRLSSPDVIDSCLIWEVCLENMKHIFPDAARASAGRCWGQLSPVKLGCGLAEVLAVRTLSHCPSVLADSALEHSKMGFYHSVQACDVGAPTPSHSVEQVIGA